MLAYLFRFATIVTVLLSCSLSRTETSITVSGRCRILDEQASAYGRRQNLKTPVEQALIRGLATA
jgi:hypothetical protein